MRPAITASTRTGKVTAAASRASVVVGGSWFLFTGMAVLALRAWRDGRVPQAAAWVGAYSASGLISPAHFVEVSPAAFDWFQLTFVVLDTGCGVALLGCAVWLAYAPGARVSSRSTEVWT